jgi:hypothetical protein
MNMSKKMWKPNFFDVIIVILVIVLAGGFYAFTHREKVIETKVQRYQVQLLECPAGLSKKVKIGDKLTDNVKKYYMGKVVAVEAGESKRLSEDRVNGRILESVMPGVESIILTVEANVTENASSLKVDGNFEIKAGREVAVKGNGYAGKGYIITVER